MSTYPTSTEAKDKIPVELPKNFISRQELTHQYLWAHFCMTNRAIAFKCKLDGDKGIYLMGVKTPWGYMTQCIIDTNLPYDKADVPEKAYDKFYTNPRVLDIYFEGLKGMVLHEEFPDTDRSVIQEFLNGNCGRTKPDSKIL